MTGDGVRNQKFAAGAIGAYALADLELPTDRRQMANDADPRGCWWVSKAWKPSGVGLEEDLGRHRLRIGLDERDHGLLQTYRHGCRCDMCRHAETLRRQRYRRNRPRRDSDEQHGE